MCAHFLFLPLGKLSFLFAMFWQLWGFHFMKVSKRFVLVLVQVLEERTGTVLRVIFFFFHLLRNLYAHFCFFLISKSLMILSEEIVSTEAIKCSFFYCIHARIVYNLVDKTLCKEARNVHSAFCFNHSSIL